MKRFTLFALAFLNTFAAFCQVDPKPKFSAEDSICLQKAAAMIRQIKADGEKIKYYLDDHFLINFSTGNSLDTAKKIRLLNIGDEKIISLAILETKLASVDSAGNPAIVLATMQLELIKEQTLPRCSSFSVNFDKFELPNHVLAKVQYLKIRLTYADKEITTILGLEE